MCPLVPWAARSSIVGAGSAGSRVEVPACVASRASRRRAGTTPRCLSGAVERLEAIDDHGRAPRRHGKRRAMTRLTWIGHSTVLIETGGRRLLTDPVLGRGIGPIRRRAEWIRHEV